MALPPGAFDEAIDDRPPRLRMGLRPVPPGCWLLADADRPAEIHEKRRLLGVERSEVLAVLPGSEPAAAEVLAAVRAETAEWAPAGEPSHGAHPIEVASLLLQEDLCLHQRIEGRWVLTAACVCFPTRWTLRDKIGRSLAGIHQPVPGYAEQLESPVDRYFDRMVPGPGVWRRNWSLVTEPDLYLPVRYKSEPVTFGPDEVGDRVWFRTERQTLRRFPQHDSILFTIRVERAPLADVVDTPERARRLLAAIEGTAPALARYKSLDRLAPSVLPWLDDYITPM